MTFPRRLETLPAFTALAGALLTAAAATPGPGAATVDFSKKVVDW